MSRGNTLTTASAHSAIAPQSYNEKYNDANAISQELLTLNLTLRVSSVKTGICQDKQKHRNSN
jgi:hypothetical protein